MQSLAAYNIDPTCITFLPNLSTVDDWFGSRQQGSLRYHDGRTVAVTAKKLCLAGNDTQRLRTAVVS